MKTLFDAIAILLVIKGIVYLFFPVWTQRFVAENIINLPVPRLKTYGILLLILALILWIIAQKYFS